MGLLGHFKVVSRSLCDLHPIDYSHTKFHACIKMCTIHLILATYCSHEEELKEIEGYQGKGVTEQLVEEAEEEQEVEEVDQTDGVVEQDQVSIKYGSVMVHILLFFFCPILFIEVCAEMLVGHN